MEMPKYVQIEPVGQCNLRCQMCPIQFRQDGPVYGGLAFMEFETFQQVVEQFGQLEHLHLQGLGEPMMHPRFFDMVEFAVQRGVRVTTNTNMTLLNGAGRARRAVTCGLDMIHASIDGASPQTYEAIRVRARFDRVLTNLALLIEARESLSSSLPRLRMVSVLMRQNLHELPDLVRLAHRFGMEEMFVQHLCHDFGESSLPAVYRPMRDFVEKQTLVGHDPLRIARYFQEARGVADELGIDLRLPRTEVRPHPPGTPGPKRCDWPWRGAYISYQGYSMPCCMISTPDRLNFGRAAEQSMAQIWNSTAYDDFRDRLASETPPEICRSCSVYTGTF